MHLAAANPKGPVPPITRVKVTPQTDRPGGIAQRYALDGADWLWDSAEVPTEPVFKRFRLSFESDGRPVRFQVSADQFFWLSVNGHWICRGPDVSPPWHYGFAEYALELPSGQHSFEAFVWWAGKLAPEARMTDGLPGFALAGIDDWKPLLSTGFAAWQVADVPGHTLEASAPQAEVLASGKNSLIDARVFFAAPTDWRTPATTQARLGTNAWGGRWVTRLLEPSALPEMPVQRIQPGKIRAVTDGLLADRPLPAEALSHPALPDCQKLLEGGDAQLVIPPHTCRSLIWDLEDYHAGWPELILSGGRDAQLRQIWSESFYETQDCRTKQKGQRGEIVGKYLVEGLGDRFIAEGGQGRRWVPYWWRCSRYCRLDLTTGAEPLTLHGLSLLRSGHPFEFAGKFSCDEDKNLEPILRICRRTLEVSSWDSYEDSPYFEQLQYIGDTRLEMLITYVLNANAELPLRALELLDQSRHQWHGLTASRFPSRGPQFISTFSLIWIVCVQDLVLWRDEPALVRRLLPGVRHTVDLFQTWRRPDGLLENLPGWPYVDWVTPDRQSPEAWEKGVPACGRQGVSALVNLIYLLALRSAADIEAKAGDPEMAARNTRLADATANSLRARFWDAGKGALKDDDSARHWSTQAQIYGILAGVLTPSEGAAALDLAARENWVPPSYMFRHYEFEAWRLLGRAGRIPGALEAWQHMIDRGSFTVWEGLEPTRSDCHAWSSHPLFHLPCSVAGIRPAAAGFARVDIAPQFGSLTRIDASVVHPHGLVTVSLRRQEAEVTGTLTLPAGITGIFRHGERQVLLQPGLNRL